MRTIEDIKTELKAEIKAIKEGESEVETIMKKLTKKTVAGVDFYSATEEIRVVYTVCLLSKNNLPLQTLCNAEGGQHMQGNGRLEASDGVWLGAVKEAQSFLKSARKNLNEQDNKHKNHIEVFDLYTLKLILEAQEIDTKQAQPLFALFNELEEAQKKGGAA